MSGKTFGNSIRNGRYDYFNGQEIRFMSFSRIQVLEEEWGMAYLTILSVGKLFSAATCTPARVVLWETEK